ncbi:MAG: hypothetical protein QOI06_256 [Nocardioidaceae bacterium]|nr:hypothetical protein [Nocardioidaceae bacterium]
MRRLAVPDDRHTLRVTTSLGSWDPARPPGLANRIREAGTAVYWRQTSADGDVIHLNFTPTRGSVRQMSGPVPKLALSGTAENRRIRLGRVAMYGTLVALTVLGLIGACAGLLIASGRSDSARVAGVLFGWFAGTVVFSVTVWSLMIGRAVRDTFRQQRATGR